MKFAQAVNSPRSETTKLICFNCVEALSGRTVIACYNCGFNFEPDESTGPNPQLCFHCARPCNTCERLNYSITKGVCHVCEKKHANAYLVKCPNCKYGYMDPNAFICDTCLKIK